MRLCFDLVRNHFTGNCKNGIMLTLCFTVKMVTCREYLSLYIMTNTFSTLINLIPQLF